MTLSYKIHTATTGDVSGQPLGYSFDFPSLSADHITVTVGGVTKTITTHYTVENWTSDAGNNPYIKFTSSTARGTGTIRISRGTTSTAPTHDFQVGSAIKAADLNSCNKQNIYLAQENRDSLNALALGDASSAIQIASQNISDLTIQAVDLATDAVETDKIKDDAVTTDKLANSINTTIAGKADTGANLSTFTNDTNYITLAQVPTTFVTGMIMMFTGSSAPSGWAFCDGNNGTPDLRDKFIVGAGSTYGVGDTGGANSVTLTESQMPSHNHTFSGSNTHSHDYKGIRGDDSDDDGFKAAVNRNDSTANITRSASAQDGVQNATITISGDTGNKGGTNGVTQSHENRPPYYALSYIMKL
jgi:microcystin-dependent protein